MDASFDIVVRFVPHYGWLYLVIANGVEYARGEFQRDAMAALMRGQAMAERIFGEMRL
jgi:hypothetical protein